MPSLTTLLTFGVAFAVTALVFLLAMRLRPRKRRARPAVRHARHASQTRPPRRSSHRAPAKRVTQRKGQPLPPIPREEMERVLADAEKAAVSSALGDLETEANPYPSNSRPGVLWETQFNRVYLEWTGKPHVRRAKARAN